MGKLTSKNKDNLKCFAKKIVKDLDRHKPWVLKDPRMLFFTDFWIKEVRPSSPFLIIQASCLSIVWTSILVFTLNGACPVPAQSRHVNDTSGACANTSILWKVAVQMKDPVCVFIFREPISNAVSLTDNAKKSAAKDGFKEMTPTRWLQAWEEGAHPHAQCISGLCACKLFCSPLVPCCTKQ